MTLIILFKSGEQIEVTPDDAGRFLDKLIDAAEAKGGKISDGHILVFTRMPKPLWLRVDDISAIYPKSEDRVP